MCRLRNIAMRDYQEKVTNGQTDAGQSDPYVPLCFAGDTKMSQCMTKRGLCHDVILVRKEHYDVIPIYFCIHNKSKSYEQRKINVIDEENDFEYVK